jgi:hypothetical protein
MNSSEVLRSIRLLFVLFIVWHRADIEEHKTTLLAKPLFPRVQALMTVGKSKCGIFFIVWHRGNRRAQDNIVGEASVSSCPDNDGAEPNPSRSANSSWGCRAGGKLFVIKY